MSSIEIQPKPIDQNQYKQKEGRLGSTTAPEQTQPQQQYPNSYPQPYNPYYGNNYQYPPDTTMSDISRIIAGVIVIPSFIFIGVILVLNTISLIIGSGIVLPNTLTVNASIMLVTPWPNFVYPITISGVILTIWYIFLIIAIIISIYWLIKTEGNDFLQLFRASAREFHPPPFKSKNSFILIAQIFFTILFFQLLITLIIILFRVPIKIPSLGGPTALWEPFFYLANASVAEEIFTRIVYIGLPLLVFDYFIRKKTTKLHRYFVGGGFKIEHVTITLIIISSLIFGLAHYPSWGLWKVFPTFVAGLGFGYLFVRKGIHTAIILHFIIDYMTMILFIFGDNISFLIFFTMILSLIILFWMASGAIYFILYVRQFSELIAVKVFGFKPTPKPTLAAGTQQARYEEYYAQYYKAYHRAKYLYPTPYQYPYPYYHYYYPDESHYSRYGPPPPEYYYPYEREYRSIPKKRHKPKGKTRKENNKRN